MKSPYKEFNKGTIIDLANLAERGQRVLHGDVIIIKCDEADMPKDFDSLPTSKNLVLAEGEHSGHAHALFEEDAGDIYVPPKLTVIEGGLGVVPVGKFTVRTTPTGEMFLKVTEQALLLRHQEHTPFRIYPGTYEIGIQQEVWDDLKRNVID